MIFSTIAGMVALVNQKMGQRQGNVNYVLYALAKTENFTNCNSTLFTNPAVPPPSTCVFQDITKGSVSVACAGGSPNCSNTSSGQFGLTASGTTPSFATGPGYDLATGLGSVNVTNLLNAWAAAAARTASVTTLSSTTTFPIAHGTPASFTVSVTPNTATGDVSLIATPSGFPASQVAVGPFTLLNGTVTFPTNLLPGGTYPVIAHYEGNGTVGASDSNPPITVTINPETSKTGLTFVTFDVTHNPTFHSGSISVAYGSPYVLRVDVTNGSGTKCAGNTPVARPSIPCPTGKVTLTDNGNGLNDFNGGNLTTLNNQGFLEDQLIQLPVGLHNLAASYAGDSSYGPSTSAASPVSATITQAATTTTVTPSPTSVVSGGSVTLTATVTTASNGAGPTGTVQFRNGSSNLGSAIACSPTSGIASSTGAAFCTATLTTALSQLVPMTRPQHPAPVSTSPRLRRIRVSSILSTQ